MRKVRLRTDGDSVRASRALLSGVEPGFSVRTALPPCASSPPPPRGPSPPSATSSASCASARTRRPRRRALRGRARRRGARVPLVARGRARLARGGDVRGTRRRRRSTSGARHRLGRVDDAANDAGRARHLPLEPADALAVRGAEDEGRGRRRAARSRRRAALGRSGRPGRAASRSTSRATRPRSTSTSAARSLHERGWRRAGRGAAARDARGRRAASLGLGSAAAAGRPDVRGGNPRHRGGGLVAGAWRPGLWRASDSASSDGRTTTTREARAMAGCARRRGGPRCRTARRVRASDVDPRAVELTRGERARGGGRGRRQRRDVRDLAPLEPPGLRGDQSAVRRAPRGGARRSTRKWRASLRAHATGTRSRVLAGTPAHRAGDAARARPLVDALQRPHRMPPARLRDPVSTLSP